MHQTNALVLHHMRDRGVEPDFRVLGEEVRTAQLAAAALGCEVGAIANSLCFLADDEPILVMTSGAHRVDTDHLASVIGATRIDKAPAARVRAATGQVIGGVAPTGHPTPLRTFVDTDLAVYQRIWAAAGTPASIMSMTYDELLRVTDGTPVQVTP
ncbi:YbaK/EbsC family protein [Calidifontibacter sp. DB0510]|uniref:YbaK/EbsC family protein n=1 Tax=Metallococcus carri TaxID=1656884 RepID=A0A967AYM7_9MICO|nr:YbaK/EbsC family protein [Metallococcus carri]NHN54230.1 YbaK/EbsC family protein [Metallococcus carri]NOP36930.1 YbaK/EbsC family protein [Calidifontibacter sp. DB2511S]